MKTAEYTMRELSLERTTNALLRDAFRVATQVPNAESPEPDEASLEPRLPYWLYVERSRATAFSRYDLRKMSEGAEL
jgi:hypothetical protein